MMMYSTSLASKYGDDAAKRFYDGDLHGAVNALNNASDVVGDGNNYKAKVSADGKSVEVSNTDLNGRELWKQKVAPGEILNAALGFKDGSLAWHAYEAAAAKYDPETAQRAQEARQQRAWDHQNATTQANWEHQQEVADAKQKQKDDAADANAKLESAILSGAPQDGAPEVTPAGNQPTNPLRPVPAPRLLKLRRTPLRPLQGQRAAQRLRLIAPQGRSLLRRHLSLSHHKLWVKAVIKRPHYPVRLPTPTCLHLVRRMFLRCIRI